MKTLASSKEKHASVALLCVTGLFAAMITITTAYFFHIPYGSNGGYIHFGDVVIYLGAVLLPRPYALAAAAIGGGVADLLTAPAWIPATVLIKMLVVLPFSGRSGKFLCIRNILALFTAAVITIGGYYLAEGILFGSFVTPIASVFGNVIQSLGSAVIFTVLSLTFDRISLKQKLQRFIQ